MKSDFLDRFTASYGWDFSPAKRHFRNSKVVNAGMAEGHRLALTMKGVIDRSIDDDEGLQSSNYETYQIFEADDLVFKLIDLENIKTSRVGYVPRRGIMSPAYIRLTKRGNRIFSRYYYWFFYSVYVQNIFNGLGGGVRQTLSPEELLKFPIPLPDLPTQRAIADFLDRETARIDLLIEKKEKMVEVLGEKRSAMITHAVTGGVSEDGDTHISKAEDRPSLEEVGGMKTKLRRLTELCNDKSQYTPSLGKYIGMEHIIPWAGKILDDADDQPEGIVSHFKVGDILFGKLRPYLAKVALPVFDGVCSTEILVLRAGKNTDPKFLRYSISTPDFIGRVNSASFGVKMPRASWQNIGSEFIWLPDLPTQRAIADFLDRETARIDNLIKTINDSIAKLSEYRSSLITAAVTGQIDINDWQKSGAGDRRLDALQERLPA